MPASRVDPRNPTDDRRHRRSGTAFALLVGLATLPAIILTAPPPAMAGTAFALVFPPSLSTREAVVEAVASGLLVLRAGALPNILIVARPTDAHASLPPLTLALGLDGLGGCLDSAGRTDGAP